jgi:hypothetical protein
MAVFVVVIIVSGKAELVINEVLSNEPDGQTTLEWIELYNDGDASAFLAFFTLLIGSNNITLPSVGVEAREYAVLSKNLTEYESYWGDGSGTWGDAVDENYDVIQIDNFSLPNESGQITLLFGSNIVSTFAWTESGEDGWSWERIDPGGTEIVPSIHPSCSTPGAVNSVTPLDYDLALLPVTVRPQPDEASVTESAFDITIANVGFQPMPAGELEIYYDSDSDGVVNVTNIITLIDYPETNPGDTIYINTSIRLPNVYPLLLLVLPDDDRQYNHRRHVRAFGWEYPPMIISEFLADPQSPLETEWVELRNRSSGDVDLMGWYLGDAIRLNLITDANLIAPAEGFVVLCEDTAAFFAYYGSIEVTVVEVPSWPTLNNDGDVVRLRDNYDVIVDSVFYEFTYGGNISWGRIEMPLEDDQWGRSRMPGGTPGSPNEVYLQPVGTKIKVSTEPDPFSPTNDNFMIIAFENPPGDYMIMKVYDMKGRLVRTLLDDVPSYDGQIEWDGTDDDGRLLPIGIYILYTEVAGEYSHKQTVVIAP